MALTKTTVDRLMYDPAGPAMQVEYDGAEIPGFGVDFPAGSGHWVKQPLSG